jgi:hypothetical protein
VVGSYETEYPQQFCLNNNNNELKEIKTMKFESLSKEIKDIDLKSKVMVHSCEYGFRKNKALPSEWKCKGLTGLKCYSDEKVDGLFTAEDKGMRWTCKVLNCDLCENCMKVGKYLREADRTGKFLTCLGHLD